MLVVTRAVYDDLIAHARERAPEECCGVLGGCRGRGDGAGDEDERWTADRYRRAANVADDPRTAYELDPRDQLAHMDAIEETGRDVVGFVHSHPRGPPEPSRSDEREATWVGYAYVIVALGGREPFVGACRWTGEGFAQEAVAVQSADRPT